MLLIRLCLLVRNKDITFFFFWRGPQCKVVNFAGGEKISQINFFAHYMLITLTQKLLAREVIRAFISIFLLAKISLFV